MGYDFLTRVDASSPREAKFEPGRRHGSNQFANLSPTPSSGHAR
jgi:hypothetical protein